MYTRICDLEDNNAVFGADILYHKNCMSSYLQKYNRAIEKCNTAPSHNPTVTVILNVIAEVNPELEHGKGFALSDLRDRCNRRIESPWCPVNNRMLMLHMKEHYGEELCVTDSHAANKSAMVFLERCSKQDMADIIRSSDPLKEC